MCIRVYMCILVLGLQKGLGSRQGRQEGVRKQGRQLSRECVSVFVHVCMCVCVCSSGSCAISGAVR